MKRRYQDGGPPRRTQLCNMNIPPAAVPDGCSQDARLAAIVAGKIASSAGTLFARPRLVDGERPAIDVLTVHRRDGRPDLLASLHLDKAEALGATCVAVHDYLCRAYGAVRREQVLQIGVGHAISKV